MRNFLATHIARIEHHVHKHHKAYHALHKSTHLGYFGCVAFHGPYHLPALALGVLLVIGWVFHIETGE